MADNKMLPMRSTLRREFGEPILNDKDAWSACWSAIIDIGSADARDEKKKIMEKQKKNESRLCSSYRLIGKLTAFLQLQEFSQRNQMVDFSPSATRRSLLI